MERRPCQKVTFEPKTCFSCSKIRLASLEKARRMRIRTSRFKDIHTQLIDPEKKKKKHLDDPATNPLLFTFSCLISGCTYARAAELLLFMSTPTPPPSAFYNCQGIVFKAIDDLLTKKLTLYQLEVLNRKESKFSSEQQLFTFFLG